LDEIFVMRLMAGQIAFGVPSITKVTRWYFLFRRGETGWQQ